MSTVYLLKNEDHQVYKIGKSNTTKNRITQLSTGNHSELTIVETFETPYAFEVESALHKKYRNKNIRGEWFNLRPTDVMNFEITCQQIENNIKYLVESGNPFIKRKH